MRSSKYLPYLCLYAYMDDMRTSQNKVKLFQKAHATMERIFSQGYFFKRFQVHQYIFYSLYKSIKVFMWGEI